MEDYSAEEYKPERKEKVTLKEGVQRIKRQQSQHLLYLKKQLALEESNKKYLENALWFEQVYNPQHIDNQIHLNYFMGILINEYRIISRVETLLLQDIGMMRSNRLSQSLLSIKQGVLPVSWQEYIPSHANYSSLGQFTRAFQKMKSTLSQIALTIANMRKSLYSPSLRCTDDNMVIRLNHLSEPQTVLVNAVWKTCLAEKRCLSEMQVRWEFIQKGSALSDAMVTDNTHVFVKGLSVQRGKINTRTLLLEEQPQRHFKSKLMVIKLVVEQVTRQLHTTCNNDYNSYLHRVRLDDVYSKYMDS